MRIVLAGDERIENPRDIRGGEFVLVALVDKLARGIDKERRVILFALFQYDDAGSAMPTPKKRLAGSWITVSI